jgi:CRISPR-associated protein Cas1
MGGLYVVEHCARVHRKRDRMEIRKGGALLANPRFDQVEVAALADSVHLSPRAAQSFMQSGAEVLFIDARCQLLGRLGADAGRRFGLRHAQRAALARPEFALDLAKRWVGGALRARRALLMDDVGTGRSDAVFRALVALRVGHAWLERCDHLAQVRAILRRADEAYHSAFQDRLRAPGFIGREPTRRTPVDPVGCLLWHGDSMLAGWLHGLLERNGVDPDLGAGVGPPHLPDLVGDLVLDLRTQVVDAVVADAINRRHLRLEDFEAPWDADDPAADDRAFETGDFRNAPFRLTPEGMKRFLTAYEGRMGERVWYGPHARHLVRREALQAQVHRLVRHLRGEDTYETDAPPCPSDEDPWPVPPPMTPEDWAAMRTKPAPCPRPNARQRLEVVEQGAHLVTSWNQVEVRKGEERLRTAAIDELHTVALFGQIHLNPFARTDLLRAGVEIVAMTRSGQLVGRYTARDSERKRNWNRQMDLYDDASWRVETARRIVAGKIRNQSVVLLRRDGRSDRMNAARAQMAQCAARLPGAADLDTVRGLEGAAAAAYFGVMGELIKAPDIEFRTRIRRPPPDPTNILLSFGYTMLTKLMHGAVELAGLDPYVGTLHEPVDNRISLALDLIEELRPVIVDTLVLALLNRRVIRATDFTPTDEGESPVEDAWEREAAEADRDAPPPRRKLLLNRDAARRFLVAFERRLDDAVFYAPSGTTITYRQLVFEQVERMKRHIWGEAPYQPFVMNA